MLCSSVVILLPAAEADLCSAVCIANAGSALGDGHPENERGSHPEINADLGRPGESA
jgi:hypothetical protein